MKIRKYFLLVMALVFINFLNYRRKNGKIKIG